jgi:hypothetical protein
MIQARHMTTATCTRSTTDRTRTLVRRVDGVEHPAPGRWNVTSSHATVEFTSPRLLRRAEGWRGRATGATIVVGENPDEITVALQVDGPVLRAITGSTGSPTKARRDADVATVQSHHHWPVHGSMSLGGSVVPVEAQLAYRGVWRRGDGAYGWFELFGTIVDGAPAKRRVRFSIELLASAPGHVAFRGAA